MFDNFFINLDKKLQICLSLREGKNKIVYTKDEGRGTV